MAAPQPPFGDDFGFNVTRVSSDSIRDEGASDRCGIIGAIRDEHKTLHDELRILRTDILDLQSERAALSTLLQRLVPLTTDVQTIALAFNGSNALVLPPTLTVLNTNTTYSLVNPQGALANLLYASHLHQDSNKNDNINRPSTGNKPTPKTLQPRTLPEQRLNIRSAPPPLIHRDAMAEYILYHIFLTAVIIYIVLLVCVYFKKTTDAQLRLRPRKANKNASIEYWNKHREEERQKRAEKEMNEQRQERMLADQRRLGPGNIRGMMSP